MFGQSKRNLRVRAASEQVRAASESNRARAFCECRTGKEVSKGETGLPSSKLIAPTPYAVCPVEASLAGASLAISITSFCGVRSSSTMSGRTDLQLKSKSGAELTWSCDTIAFLSCFERISHGDVRLQSWTNRLPDSCGTIDMIPHS